MSTNNPFPEHANKKIEEGSVVVFLYTLKDDDGNLIDESPEEDPFFYLQGSGVLIPGLEREMEGKVAGDHFQVEVEPEDAYGAIDEDEELLAVERETFPEDMGEIVVGMPIVAELSNNETCVFHVKDMDEKTIYLSANHPLAGKKLHFDVRILGVRDATEEEMEHGHPHGLHGDEPHHHDHDDEGGCCGGGHCGCH